MSRCGNESDAEYRNGGYMPPPLDDGIAVLLYILSFFVPLAGIIGGIVLLNSVQPRNRDIGRNMIIFAILPTVSCCALAFLLSWPFMLF